MYLNTMKLDVLVVEESTVYLTLTMSPIARAHLEKISYNDARAVISNKFVETNKYVMWSA